MYQIQIVEGHDPTNFFWFRPVRVKESAKILVSDVEEFSDEFSIEEGDVECFLAHFFRKYFDRELRYNKNRWEPFGFITGFEWWLIHNFYTYQTVRTMLNDISHTADLLEHDYDSPELDAVKQQFDVRYLCPPDSEDYSAKDPQAIQRNIGVVIDFYRRFVDRLFWMMENNPETFLLSIMGP